MRHTAVITMIMMVMLMLVGCTTTRYVTIETVRTDTLHHTIVRSDSVYIKDSTSEREYTRGDTVYKERDRWRDRWHDRTVHDTVYHSRVDSIPVPVPVEVVKEVEAPLPWYTKLFVVIGQIVAVILGGGLLVRIVKMKFRN